MNQTRHDRPTWAGRVPRHKIAELYKKEALGICDEVLIDDVGIDLLVRIEHIFRARNANSGLARCPLCQREIAARLRPGVSVALRVLQLGIGLGRIPEVVSG